MSIFRRKVKIKGLRKKHLFRATIFNKRNGERRTKYFNDLGAASDFATPYANTPMQAGTLSRLNKSTNKYVKVQRFNWNSSKGF